MLRTNAQENAIITRYVTATILRKEHCFKYVFVRIYIYSENFLRLYIHCRKTLLVK